MAKKKAVRKKAKKKSKVLKAEPKNLTPAHYNPRKMDQDAASGLESSMEQFQDISGITWNQRTGNIVTGHHRWKTLCNKYGQENLTFESLRGSRFAIMVGDVDTEYSVRVVDWDEAMEKAANITANSHKLEGQFTVDLTSLLSEIRTDIPENLFSELRLDDLNFEFEYLNGNNDGSADSDDWDTDIEAIKKVEEDDHQTKPEFATISINVKTEEKAELLEAIKELLAEREYEIQ